MGLSSEDRGEGLKTLGSNEGTVFGVIKVYEKILHTQHQHVLQSV